MNLRGEAQQRLEGRHRGAPTVEAERELVQVRLEVVVTDAMMRARQPRLEIPKDPVDVRQDLPGPLRRPLGAGSMTEAHGRQRGVGAPAIREDEGARRNVVLHEPGQRASRGVGHDVETDPARGRPAHLDRSDDQSLIQELAATLEADLGTAHVGFVDFDPLLQRLPAGSHHGSAELVQQRPGRLVTEPELALQLDRRQPGRMGRHEVGRPEPHRQWQPRPMQHCARRQGGLSAACLALP